MSGDLTPHDPNEVVAADPIADPGLPEHLPRPTDIDEKAEKRAERQVAGAYLLSSVCAVLFVVAYLTLEIGETPDVVLGMGASNAALGLSLGLGMLLIGAGTIQWARKLMSDHEMVEMRHPAKSPEEDREAAITAFNDGVEDSGIMRRPLIRNSLLGALGIMGVPAVFLLGDLGPLPGDKLYRTVWKKGVRVVKDVSGEPILAANLEVGDLVNAEPDVFFNEELYGPIHGHDLLKEKAKAAVIVFRMEPKDITPWEGREDWAYEGIVCYSKICTHVGCPISLAEQQTHHLLCPCHQSTFDLGDNGKVVFGPAARALPQLPLSVDPEGYLIAQSDFTEPVGPSFWERG